MRCALIAALGGLLFGFDTAVVSGTVKDLESVFQLNKWWLGFTVSFALFGTILGAATAQIPSNLFGRKPTLVIMAILFLLASIGTAYPEFIFAGKNTSETNIWYSFMIFRFLGGMAIGAASVVSPLYIAEISPAKSRGLFVGFFQFGIVFGILLAFFSNFIISSFELGVNDWRWMFGVMAVPSAVFLLLLFTTPESPRWLVTHRKLETAKTVLERLGTDGNSPEEEVAVIQKAIEEEQLTGTKEKFFCHRYRWPIFLAICIAAFNQLSGINAVMYFAPTIFASTGVDEKTAMFLPVIIGLTNLIVTMIALSVVDKFGRKTLMYVGSVGYVTSMAIVGWAFMNWSPQFNVATANYTVTQNQDAIIAYQKDLSDEKIENREVLETNLKETQIGQILALEDAKVAAAKLAGQSVTAKTDAENETWKQELKNRTVAELNTQLNTEIQGLKGVNQEEFASSGKVQFSSTVPMNAVMIVLGGLMLFIASHAFGNGSIIWTFVGEIFPNKVRAQGQALGSFTHWVFCAMIGALFIPLLDILGPATIFYGFSGLMVFQFLWTLFLMPETKQVSLEDMQKKLGIV